MLFAMSASIPKNLYAVGRSLESSEADKVQSRASFQDLPHLHQPPPPPVKEEDDRTFQFENSSNCSTNSTPFDDAAVAYSMSATAEGETLSEAAGNYPPSLADFQVHSTPDGEGTQSEYDAAELVLVPGYGLGNEAGYAFEGKVEYLGSALPSTGQPRAEGSSALPSLPNREETPQEAERDTQNSILEISSLNSSSSVIFNDSEAPNEVRRRHQATAAPDRGATTVAPSSPGQPVRRNDSARNAVVQDPRETDAPANIRTEVLPPLTVAQITAFAIPALGSVLADPLMSLVDTACVGQVSSIGLAALGPNTTIFMFVSMMFSFFTIATTSMVAKAHARGQHKEISQTVSDGIILSVVLGTITTALMIGNSEFVFTLLNTSGELMKPAKDYLYWRALALPCTLISFVGTAACLGQRDSSTPLKVAGISGAVNLIVDLFLVLGPPKMGITGAAMATAGSQLMAALWYMGVLSKRMNLQFRVPSWEHVKPYLTAASVLTLRSTFIMSVFMMMTSRAAALGTLNVATHQVLIGVLTVAQFVPEPMSSAAQTFLASTAAPLRAGTSTPVEKQYAKQAGRLLLICTTALGVGLAAVAGAICKFIPGIFTSDPLVMANVSRIAPLMSLSILFYSLVCQMDGIIFAGQDMKFSATMQCINLPAMMLLLKMMSGHALIGIWFAFMLWNGVRFLENGFRVLPKYVY